MATIKSIKEKAKAYDKAIEKIQRYVKDDFGCTRLRPEDIFPELKESEDERVRKELLSFFIERAKYTEDSTFNGLSSKDIISWLEKQGEQKPQGKSALEAINEEKVDNANKVEPRQEELTEFERAVKQVMEEAIECGDTHNLKADAEMLLSLIHKSAWSEEDDIMKQNCHQMLALLRPNSSELIKDIIDNCHHWLKSLKNRVQPQSTWKPSDEQIKTLENVRKILHSKDIYSKAKSLMYNFEELIRTITKLKE